MSGLCSFPQVMGHEVVAQITELGPEADGFDVDPNARPAAEDLARRNGVSESARFATGGFELLEELPGPYDAVLANLYLGHPAEPAPGYSNTRALGRILYTDYAFAFEIAGVVLLVAIVAAISLTMRKRKDRRGLDPSVQLKARPEERVRLVSMPAEKDE